MHDTVTATINEARYAERLCLRTARLYRHLQAFGTFGTVFAGSAAMGAALGSVPQALAPWGAMAFAAFGAALLAIRPADKAAANEADARRYAKVRTEAATLDAAAARQLLDKARETDAAEVESLRDVAYNDVLAEIGRPDLAIPLGVGKRMLAAIA